MSSSSKRSNDKNGTGRSSSHRERTHSNRSSRTHSRFPRNNSGGDRGSSSRRSFERNPAESNENRERTIAAGPSNMVNKTSLQLSSRPGYGRVGKPISVQANFFKLSFNNDIRISQYSVRIQLLRFSSDDDARSKREQDANNKREKDQASSSSNTPAGSAHSHSSRHKGKVWKDVSQASPIDFNRNVFDLFVKKNNSELEQFLVYDGRSIAYAPSEINRSYLGTDHKFQVDRDGKEVSGNKSYSVECRVRIEHAKYFDSRTLFQPDSTNLQSAECLAALDVALSYLARKKHIQVGKSFYNSSDARDLDRVNVTARAWKGFYQSARLTELGLTVNVDESWTAFWDKEGKPLKDLYNAVQHKEYANLRKITSRLMHLKVRALHTNIVYKVHGFKDSNPFETEFHCEQMGRKVTIAEYFSKQYNHELKDKKSPLVITNIKKGTLVPMELLTVEPNQRITGTLRSDQIQSMVKIAKTKPQYRKRNAIQTMEKLQEDLNLTCNAFRIAVETNPIEVNARVLHSPKIKYEGHMATTAKGCWNRQNGKFLNPGVLDVWMILMDENVRNFDVTSFLNKFKEAARNSGMYVLKDPQPTETFRDGSLISVMNCSAKQLNQEQSSYPRFMIFVLARQNTKSYNTIKREADLRIGIATQVIIGSKFPTDNDHRITQNLSNLMLKVNTKLGGQTSIINKSLTLKDKCFSKPYIILGADVTHPSTNGKSCSVAALVGSADQEGVQYSSSLRCQRAGQEIISDLGSMFRDVYNVWFANHGKREHASSIFMFRDGVSESQFQAVKEQEIASIRSACKALKFYAKVTYIIVTKRHHARFFPLGNGDKNISPGTVIEKDITSKNLYEFYLNSHEGILGTNRPSKYTVLVDENNLDVDQLQEFIFQLTHCFVRCNRSVSMVNCVHYAHLLAYRGRIYLKEDESDTASNSSNRSGSIESPKIVKCAGDLHKILYYC